MTGQLRASTGAVWRLKRFKVKVPEQTEPVDFWVAYPPYEVTLAHNLLVGYAGAAFSEKWWRMTEGGMLGRRVDVPSPRPGAEMTPTIELAIEFWERGWQAHLATLGEQDGDEGVSRLQRVERPA